MKMFKVLIVLMLILSGCSSESQLVKTYRIILEPVKEENLISYYVSGLPMGATSLKDFDIIFNLQPVEILGEDYLRLWFLIQNNSDNEVLFEPTKEFKLTYSKLDKSNFKTINPESPLSILNSIENAKQVDMIFETIGSTLKSIGTTNTKIKSKSNNKELGSN